MDHVENLLFGARYLEIKFRLKQSAQLGRALDLMEAEYWNPDLTVVDLARAAGMSGSGLNSAFREIAVLSPYQFLIRYRLLRATILITPADRSMVKVAMDVGFASARALNRHFNSLLGITPTVFQKGMRS